MSLKNRNQYPPQVRGELENLDRQAARANASHAFVPIGGRIKYDGLIAPEKWRFSDGAEVSRTKYEALFRVIRVTHGDGDGVTSFNLPNEPGEIIYVGVL